MLYEASVSNGAEPPLHGTNDALRLADAADGDYPARFLRQAIPSRPKPTSQAANLVPMQGPLVVIYLEVGGGNNQAGTSRGEY